MKIGFVLDDSLDSPDGVQQYVLTLGAWLVSNGHDVHYLVGETSRQDIANIHSLSRNVRVSFNKNRLSIPLPVSRKKLQRFLNEQQFDALHVQLPYSPQFAARVISAAPAQTAIVGTFHIMPYGKLQKAGARALGMLLGSSLKRFDHIVAVSPAAQSFAKSAMGISSSVVPNAVDLRRFTFGKRSNASTIKTIGFLGRLVPRKGAMELLEAVQWLKSNNLLQDRQVLIGGSGPEMAKLTRYVTNNRLDKNVAFIGQVDESAKADFFASCDVVALPSLAGESFGIVVVEAIASGAGVTIGGNNPGYSFVLSETSKTLIDPRNTEGFAQLLDQMLSDDELRSSLQKKQQAHIRQFDVPVVGAQIEAIYTKAVKKHAKV